MKTRPLNSVGRIIGLAGLLILLLILLLELTRASAGVTPTNEWVNFGSANSTFLGQPVPAGAVVAAFDPDGIQCAEFTAQQLVSILDVPLIEGWNLMSAYVNPFTTDVEVVQRPIQGQYVVIQGFDRGGLSYYPDLPPEVNSLTEMDGEHGYWVKVKAAGELEGTQGNGEPQVRLGEPGGTQEISSASATAATLRVVGEKFAEDRPGHPAGGAGLAGDVPVGGSVFGR